MSLGVYQGTKLLSVVKMREVKSYNRFTNHILKASVAKAYRKKGPAPQSSESKNKGTAVKIKATEDNFVSIVKDYFKKSGEERMRCSLLEGHLKLNYNQEQIRRLMGGLIAEGTIVKDDDEYVYGDSD